MPYSSIQIATVLARWQPPGQVLPDPAGPGPASRGPREHRVGLAERLQHSRRAEQADNKMIVGDVSSRLYWDQPMSRSCWCWRPSALTQQVLDGRRIHAWDAEWEQPGPRGAAACS